MITVLPIRSDIQAKTKRFGIEKKLEKQLRLFVQNPNHPSLHTELLFPKNLGIYSFRIDHKFRALFFYRSDKGAIEIITVTSHYH